MKLLLLDQFSEPGGAQQVLLELLPAFRERGWTAKVAMPGDGPMFPRIRALGFETVRIVSLDRARFAFTTPLLALQIRALSDVDLIYVNGPRLLPAAAMAYPSAPVVFHAHSFLPPCLARRLAGESIYRTGARVIANCKFTAAPWQEFAAAPPSIIYNGVAAPAEPQRTAAPYPRVGSIGRIAPEKGQREFVQAAAIIHRELPECRFAIHGAPMLASPRYADQVHAAARELPLDFAGWSADVYEALANLDLLLVPSGPREATTRVILEAFAAGVPVIAFRSGGIPEIIEHGRTGYLADTVAEMAGIAIGVLSGLRDARTTVAAAARESWKSRFTLERFQTALISELESVVFPKSA